MIVVDTVQLNQLSNQALQSKRLRKNFNFHTEASDVLQRMLNAIEPGTYVQPHKHESPDKREVFIVLRGRVLVVEFTSQGDIASHVVLDHSTGHFAVEFAPGIYHAMYSLQTGTVVYELKDGPYSPADDKHFASWAPREGDAGCSEYLSTLFQRLAIAAE